MQHKSLSSVVVKIHFDLTHLDLSKILICLILFELLLIAAYGMDVALDSPSWVINKLVDLDNEGSIATWFSSIQLFIVGLLFFVKSYQVDANSTELPSRQFFWIMGLGLLFLSVDEAAAIHEKVSMVLKQAEFMPRFKGSHGIWIYVYAFIAGIFCILMCRNFIALWKKFPHAALIMALGISTFITGAVFLEILSYQFFRDDLTSFGYVTEVALEEFLEMLGISILLYSVLLLLVESKNYKAVAEPIKHSIFNNQTYKSTKSLQ